MLVPALLVPVVAALSVGTAAPASVSPAAPEPVCTPSDERVAELSGLGVRGGVLLAAPDSGGALSVAVLDASTCDTVGVLDAEQETRDVEDLAVDGDGTVWLADTGDNGRSRSTVALVALRTGGDGAITSTVHRLTYPDGPHDAEAVLLEPGGRPVLVTKEPSGVAGVYAPDGVVASLASPGPTAMQRVGQLRISPTDTPGGPVPLLGSTLVTGGAVSADGSVVAVRTYTDAYLFAAADGDAAAALSGRPVRVPLADEPQGEAIAFTTDGTLLSGSESDGGALPPVRRVAGAVALVSAAAQAPPTPGPIPTTGDAPAPGGTSAGPGADGIEPWQAAIIAVVVAGSVYGLLGLFRRRR